jgi:hypothetical protein
MKMVQNKKKIRMPTLLEGENLKKTTNLSNLLLTKSNPSNFKKFNSTMVSHMMVNGWMEDDKVLVSRFGLMALSTKASGKTTKPTDKESFIMLMEMYTRVNGSMIKPVARALIHMRMEPNMSGSGKMISRMDSVLNNGLTAKFMKVSTRMVPRLEKVS